MIAALAITVSEVYHPFYNIPGPATEHFAASKLFLTPLLTASALPNDFVESCSHSLLYPTVDQYIPNFWLIPFTWTGLFEIYSIRKGTRVACYLPPCESTFFCLTS